MCAKNMYLLKSNSQETILTKKKKKKESIVFNLPINLCTGFCGHFLIIIHVVEPWRYY